MSVITAKASRKMKKYAVLTREPRCFLGSFVISWEQRKFGEITSKYEDPVPTPHDGYYRLGIRSHAKGTFHSYVAKGQELETAQMHRVAAGNFIVNITFGWEHAVAITDENDAGKLVSHRFPQFSFAEGMVPEFFRYVIVDEKFRHHLWLASPGGAGRNRVLKLDEMLNYLMRFPSRDEQIKIAEFFRQLDNLITLHQRKYAFLFRRFRAAISKKLATSTFSWEQRKLGDIADIVGGGTPSTGNQSYWDGDIDWYAPAEIADQIYANSSQKKITGLGYENSSAKMLPPGTVLFTSRAGIGKTAILTRKGCTNQGFQSIVPHRGELDSYFIFSRTEELKRYGELVGAGSTFVEVSGKQMAVMELMMPPTMREQQTIGGFFQQLDHLITLHQRERISFSGRASRLIPPINKKRITSSWEQRKLSEMCGTFEYGLNAAAKEFDGKNKYIRITDIDDASREFLLSDLSSPDICLDGMSKYLLSSGDIVFARTGASVGKTYIYRENDGIVYFAGFLIRAKVNQDNDAEFVFQSTLSPSYEKYIRITSQRSGQPGVNAQEYGEYDLFAPSKEEQQRIGQFLRGIDHLITLHQRKPFLMKWRTSDANRN